MLELFNFLHFLGLAFGLGGATIATFISFKAEKDKDIAKVQGKIMNFISKFIFMGLVLLIISGIAIPYYMTWPLNKQLLLVKHILVVWIVVIGFFIGRASKKAGVFAPVGKEKIKSEFLIAKKQVKFFSLINLVLWYVVTLLSAFV